MGQIRLMDIFSYEDLSRLEQLDPEFALIVDFDVHVGCKYRLLPKHRPVLRHLGIDIIFRVKIFSMHAKLLQYWPIYEKHLERGTRVSHIPPTFSTMLSLTRRMTTRSRGCHAISFLLPHELIATFFY